MIDGKITPRRIFDIIYLLSSKRYWKSAKIINEEIVFIFSAEINMICRFSALFYYCKRTGLEHNIVFYIGQYFVFHSFVRVDLNNHETTIFESVSG